MTLPLQRIALHASGNVATEDVVHLLHCLGLEQIRAGALSRPAAPQRPAA